MSGGKACGKEAAQYTGKRPGEGNVVTSRDSELPKTRCIRLVTLTESQFASKKWYIRLDTRTDSQYASKKCLCEASWGKGANRKRQTAYFAEEEDALHEARKTSVVHP